MLNKALEISLNDAFRLARERQHELMTVEHLLVALLDNPEASEALRACGIDFAGLKSDLLTYIDRSTPRFPENDLGETQPTLGFQRVLQRAVFHVQSSGNSEVTGANVLVAIFSEQESQAVYLLNKHEVTRLDVVNFISHGISRVEEEKGAPIDSTEATGETEEQSFLARFCVNLNQRAKAG